MQNPVWKRHTISFAPPSKPWMADTVKLIWLAIFSSSTISSADQEISLTDRQMALAHLHFLRKPVIVQSVTKKSAESWMIPMRCQTNNPEAGLIYHCFGRIFGEQSVTPGVAFKRRRPVPTGTRLCERVLQTRNHIYTKSIRWSPVAETPNGNLAFDLIGQCRTVPQRWSRQGLLGGKNL